MKEKIELLDYSTELLKKLNKGILLTTKVGDKVNSMVISWGSFGIEWSKNIFTIYVRQNRYTKQLLDKNPEFTLNFPVDKLDMEVMKMCGTKSGRDIDKVKQLGLHLVESDEFSVPAIAQYPLTLECKVVYKQDQDLKLMPQEMVEKFYPENIDGNFHSANRDYHTAYYGEVVNAYIIK